MRVDEVLNNLLACRTATFQARDHHLAGKHNQTVSAINDAHRYLDWALEALADGR